MSSYNDVFYDAHIKTYQRYTLIAWLESAKSEKIRAMKDSFVIPTERYVAPVFAPMKPVSFEKTEQDREAFKRKFDGIVTKIPTDNIGFSSIPVTDGKELSGKFSNIFNASMIKLDDPHPMADINDSISRSVASAFSGASFGIYQGETPVSGQIRTSCRIDDEKFAGIRTVKGTLSHIPSAEELNSAVASRVGELNNVYKKISPLSPIQDAEQINSAVRVDSGLFNDVHISIEAPDEVDLSAISPDRAELVARSASGAVLSANIKVPSRTVVPESVVSLNNENNASVLVDVKVPDMLTLPEHDAENKKIYSDRFADVYRPVSLPAETDIREQIAANKSIMQDNAMLNKTGGAVIGLPEAVNIPEITIDKGLSSTAAVNAVKEIRIPDSGNFGDLTGCSIAGDKFSNVTVDVSIPGGFDLTNAVSSMELPSASLPNISGIDLSEVFEALTSDQGQGVNEL